MPGDFDSTTYLVMPQDEALDKVSGHIKSGKQLLETSVTNHAELRDIKFRYRKWREYGIQLLRNMFSDESMAERLQVSVVVASEQTFSEEYEDFRQDFLNDITTLESIEEMLPIMPQKKQAVTPKRSSGKVSPSVTQIFHGQVGNAIGSTNGHVSQNSTHPASSDNKLWQLFLALLGVAGAIAAAYIAHKMHWV